MRIKKIPQIIRNAEDSSIKITYGRPKCSLIWLHGLCDNSEGFYSYFAHSHSPVYNGVSVKLIQAPLKNITINKGQVCHGWYDIYTTDRFKGDEKKVFNFDDIKQTHDTIANHVQEQIQQWKKYQPLSKINPYHRVYVGGFSQGGVMALSYSMQSKIPPAGCISLSGYMLRTVQYTNFRKVPTLLMHGTRDPIIRQVLAKQSYKKLLQDENLVQYYSINGLQHSVNLEQLDTIKQWIDSTFKTIQNIYEGQTKMKQNTND